jgi:hypothetical protein
VPCLPSTPPFPPQTPPTPSPASSSVKKQCFLPYEATRARPALLATLLLKQAEGPPVCPQKDTRSRLTIGSSLLSEQSEGHTHHPYDDTKASSARKTIASLQDNKQLSTSEGNNTRVRDVSSLTWSSPPITPSRFASVNPFHVLSDLDVSPPAPVKSARATPLPTKALSSISAPPIIADTGCTGLLIQFSNFPALSPFFTPKPLPLVPFTLPDRSVLLVGGPSHLTGELSFPSKALRLFSP